MSTEKVNTMGPLTTEESASTEAVDASASTSTERTDRPLGRIRIGLLFVCGGVTLVALHGLALALNDWCTVLYGLVFGAALTGIWLWTTGTRRLVVIVIAAVVSVVARETLLPLLEGAGQVVGIAVGIMLGALDIRELEFWRRLRNSERVVEWPTWRVCRPNVFMRLLTVVPAAAFLWMFGSMCLSNWRHEHLVADIKRFGGSVHADSARDMSSWFNHGIETPQLRSVRLGPTNWDRSANFYESGETIAGRPQDVTSEYVDDLVRRIGNSKGLKTLLIADPDVTNAAFSTYAGLNELEYVRISCPQVTDSALAFLGTQPRLYSLELPGTAVTGEMFAQRAFMTPIRSLYLRDTRVDDRGIVHIAKIRSLGGLDLSGTLITDAAMPEIGKCLGLRMLDLSDTKVTDAGLPDLASLNWLSLLKLNHCNVTAREVSKLADSVPLGGLTLGGIDLTDDDLAGIARFKQILGINLRGAVLGEASLSQLTAATSLHMLDLSHSNVTDQHIEALRGFTEFGHTIVSVAATGGTGPGMASAGLNTPRESHEGWLSLKDTAITDKSLEVLATLPSITGLDLTDTSITDAGLDYLAQLPHLRTLAISDTEISDEGLRKLEQFPALEDVGIDNTNVTEAGFKRLRAACPDIQRLPPQPPDE